MRTFKEILKEMPLASGGRSPDDVPRSVDTGFRRLDAFLRGMDRGSLTVLCADRSSDGVAFALNVVKNLLARIPCPGIAFSSGTDGAESASLLLDIGRGTPCRYDADLPLFFLDFHGVDAPFLHEVRALHSRCGLDLLIVDGVDPDGCRDLKTLARESGIAVLALAAHDAAACENAADTAIRLSRSREAADPDLGIPAELTVFKNAHGVLGTSVMYIIPQTMNFMESRLGDTVFVAIPETYEPVTPCGELRRYLAPENLPLSEHLRAEIPTPGAPLNLSDVLSLSARLEAVGDHDAAVKVFRMGRNACGDCERGAEVVYDWMFAAMYYWLFRDMDHALRCMARAKTMLDKDSETEYRELERRLKTYRSAEWIGEEEVC